MTKQEIENAIQALIEASRAISSLDRDFKTKNGIYNLDYTLDEIIEKLKIEITD